ncbi:hypothetical protein PY092_08870 [Muricauda sp. 334s03]|uniref:DUF6973 domain-containing protein n=1 Tax=Flagellimonas yonaguniensis TaxID=3031325 RepID=A0ABT5XYU3_9FLAO|nr:hypothetical protein [[Muricauda] yonaguniensis]MDF0716256.1 hypothetical protein [[Muricauda] yonaguniensis]
MKTNFKLLFPSLLVLVLFNACNETFEEQVLLEESQSNEIITVQGEFDEFNELKNLYDKVVVEEIKKNTTDKKGDYNFQIDSTNVIKKSFENDDYYTFSVIRENDIWPNFENLVISNKDEQEPEAYLFVYIPDEAYLERFQENPNTAFSGSIEAKPLDYEKLMSSAGGCINYTTEICNYGGHTDNGLGEGVAGPGCQDTYIVNNTVCFISPNPFDGVGGGGGSSDGGSGGGGGSSNDSDLPLADSDVITKVVVTHEQLHQLNSDLGFVYASPEAYWVRSSANKDKVSQLINFVEANKVNGQIPLEVKSISSNIVTAFINGQVVGFEQDYKGRMSSSERAIFDSMSRFKQLAYLVNAQKATWASEDLYPHSSYNGKGDAFRHAYFNGLNAILLGPILAEDLATAHEDKPAPPNYPNYFKEVQMDLFNNQVGRDKMNWLVDGYDSLTESILEALTNGELRYLSNLQGNGASGRATNQSQLIPTN